MNSKVLCAGSLIVDIFNKPVERALGPNEGVTTNIFALPGGNAFNVSKDLVGLGFPAGDCTCLGSVGDDMFGRMFADELGRLGVAAELHEAAGSSTSKIFMLKVENEEPRYYLDEGANALLSPEYVAATINRLHPALFYTGETAILRSLLTGFSAVMRTARSAGCLTIVDTVIPPDGDWGYIYKAAGCIDILKCNEYEAAAMTGTTDMHTALRLLAKTGIPLPIISLAEKGTLFSYNDLVYAVPPFRVQCVDPLGAGDAFNAGLIRSLIQLNGTSLQERLGCCGDAGSLIDAVVYATACGAAAVTEFGCWAGVIEAQVTQLIAGQGRIVRSGISSGPLRTGEW